MPKNNFPHSQNRTLVVKTPLQAPKANNSLNLYNILTKVNIFRIFIKKI